MDIKLFELSLITLLSLAQIKFLRIELCGNGQTNKIPKKFLNFNNQKKTNSHGSEVEIKDWFGECMLTTDCKWFNPKNAFMENFPSLKIRELKIFI